eukprot:Seg1343.2 transcript_id=Seg1343.2/GoldUCD/mRNA.D3Y31 product="Polyubiquitin 9" protein_id=Seg1343.2/GoldUCD/D3Y31
MLRLNVKTRELLKARLKRLENWSEERATEGVDAYEQFLKLKAAMKDYKAKKLSPTPLIEEVWHFHVLDTQRYADDCLEFCGEVIHHDIDGDIDTRKLEIQRNATEVAYEMQNGKEPEGEMWTFDAKNCSDQNLQHNSTSCEETPPLENDLAEVKSEKILMTIDVTNKQEFHELVINASNGHKFVMHITYDVHIQEVLESVGNFEGRTDFEDWGIFGKDHHEINYHSFTEMCNLIQNHGPNWTIEFPGQTLARRIKNKQMFYINLVPADHIPQAYYVGVTETSGEYYRVKVHKGTSLQEIIRCLPTRTGTWKLADEESTLKEIKLQESSIVNLQLNSNSHWFQIFVKTPISGTITLEVFSCNSIKSLKEGIKAKIGLDVASQALYFAGKKLQEGCTLFDYNISRQSTVFLEQSWNST